MEQMDLQGLRLWLENSSAAQLLFAGDTLVAASAQALRYLPGVFVGGSAEQVFGDQTEAFLCFDGKGCLLLTIKTAEGLLNCKAAPWMGHTMVELSRDLSSLTSSAMLTISDHIMDHMTTLMALSPKLLPQVPETGGNIQKAALFNRSLYGLLREARNIQSSAVMPQSSLSTRVVNMSIWLMEFGTKLQPLCVQAGRRLVLDVPGRGPLCNLATDRMERALLNLVSNAIKFTEPEGTVTLRMKKLPSGRIRLTVEDDGCGIAPDQMDTVFQRKEHRRAIPDPREGMGLGLLVARNIAIEQGGVLILESQQGQGTRVHITLEPGEIANDLIVRSDVRVPAISSGYDPMLVELSQVLPWQAYDSRGID